MNNKETVIVREDGSEVNVMHYYDTDAVIIIPYRRKILNGRWFMGFQDFFRKLASDNELNLTDRRVLDYLFSIMDLDNYVSVPQKEIAERLNVSLRAVRKSISKLKHKGILKVKRIGKFNAYMLNPNFVWKGKIKNLNGKIVKFGRF